jgi:DNA-damage-inducible protein D
MTQNAPSHLSPFEQIKQTDPDTGAEYWSSRDFARVLEYNNYQNFETVIEKSKLACFNSEYEVDDHFNGAVKMITLGKGAPRRF